MGKKGNKNLDSLAWQWIDQVDSVIGEKELKSSYRLLLPKCNNCRKNLTGNPCCLCALGETIWTKSSSVTSNVYLKKVEQDLEADRRSQGELIGLRNLGATCYVNTYLQLWFHNLDFRKAIYALEDHSVLGDESLPQTICGQLQLMFGLLQNSVSKSVDPSSFIKCLGLPVDLQQDAQEFSKLFMSLLETIPGLSEVIKKQFCGKYAYVTKCLKCQTVVETPAEFYELDLNIQGLKDLKSCINDFLKEEQLQNDNQYFCDNCQSKQDAVRKIVLKELSPTLSIQLLRFVYDRASQRKHKITTNLSFPEKLDFSSFVASQIADNSSLIYQLSAVLLHRGLGASSGHFVAHILDLMTNCWFQFNDEVVVKMKSGRKLNLDINDNEDVWTNVLPEPAAKKTKTSKGCYSSKDVYMLVYTRQVEQTNLEVKVPEKIARVVEEKNLKFELDIKESYRLAEEEQKSQQEQESKMRDLIQLLKSDSNDFEWIPTAILKNYLQNGKLTTPNLLATSKLLCAHGNLSLSCLNTLKYIPKIAADVIYVDSKDAERLSCRMCEQCVYNQGMFLRGKKKLATDSSLMSDAIKKFEKEILLDCGECFYVGRLSVRKWKSLAMQDLTRKYVPKSLSQLDAIDESISEQSDNEDQFVFNSDLLCPHKNLTTDITSYQVVPQLVWDILFSYFPTCSVFKTSDSVHCLICVSDAKAQQEAVELLKSQASEQKNCLYQLYLNKNRPNVFIGTQQKCVNEKYFVVSADFIEKWRDFVRNPTKYDPVIATDNSLFLCKHKKLLYDLQMAMSIERHCEEDDSLPKFILLWEREWACVKEFFKIDYPICVQKTVILPCSVLLEKIEPVKLGLTTLEEQETDSKINRRSPSPSVLIQASSNSEVVESDSKQVLELKFNPDLCTDCMQDLAHTKKEKMRTYTDADIYVVKSTKTVVEILEESNTCISPTTGRRSNRSRRCVRGEKRLSNVSSAMTLKQLKLRIMNLFSVPPFDQNLWLNGIFLTDDNATLGSLNVVPESIITLVEDVPDPNEMPYIYDAVKPSEPEVGFIGTSLIGHIGS